MNEEIFEGLYLDGYQGDCGDFWSYKGVSQEDCCPPILECPSPPICSTVSKMDIKSCLSEQSEEIEQELSNISSSSELLTQIEASLDEKIEVIEIQDT